MFLIEFNLRFQEITKSTAYRHCRNEGKVHQSLKMLAGKEWLFPKFFFSFAISCLLVPKNSSSAVLFHLIAMFWERGKKLRNVHCDFFKLHVPKPIIILLLLI